MSGVDLFVIMAFSVVTVFMAATEIVWTIRIDIANARDEILKAIKEKK